MTAPDSRRNPKLDPEDFYLNEDGLMVFTRRFHLKRGHCCGSGCKHCPYDHIAVPKDRAATKP